MQDPNVAQPTDPREVRLPDELAKDEQQDAEPARSQPEFVWSKALYRARKAAEEFSEETHADY